MHLAHSQALQHHLHNARLQVAAFVTKASATGNTLLRGTALTFSHLVK
jgi:hypothetical protein